MGRSMIELQDIAKIYRMGKVEVPALRGINLTINQGEMVAIVGASGSGKSTLMNIIGFLDKPTVGRYLLEGIDASQYNDDKLAELRNKKIGFVFQTFNLLPRATAISNVELPLIYSGSRQKRQRSLEALERVGLAGRANHRPTELSGGEQQRVAIARALINDPAIILADEPTGNLDSAATNEIISIFCQLNQEGITVVLVTHEMDVANRTQRIIRLLDGKIISDEKVTGNNNAALRKQKDLTARKQTETGQ
jgi:putative ABC transport system ATP-binding protein